MRLVKVNAWQLTDDELDEVAADLERSEPEYAAELRRLKAWRRDNPASPLADERGRAYLVLR